MTILTKQIPEWKTKQIDLLAERMKKANTVAIVDFQGLSGKQFHDLRRKLRKSIDISVFRKIIVKFALDKIKSEKERIGELQNNLGNMPAILLSELGPFQISKLLLENKAPSPAKPGDIAPEDIVIDEGPTPFPPGPMISVLSGVGLKVKVDAGKIVVMKKSTIVKQGEEIKPEVADILMKLNIQPMEVGLDLTSAWENNFVFAKEVLRFDAGEYLSNLSAAADTAFRLSLGLPYPTKENITILVSKAYNDAKALALGKDIFVDALVPQLLSKASAQASGLSQYVEEHEPAEKQEEKSKEEEKPVEEKTEEKTEEKPEENKE